ncbi:Sugar phosphate permease [Noviherbaspirillum humi]|uniref:Sugar phosphate permease n=1 Tax=Noviherbaspirillum humi TaxID=1688639 RepID=A0A239LBW8_9BURK|nr:MFS transporter [Noviherbaspirillum humi]SNT27418.1 Sugar phosphate permease [Noviherbaspirillum humi]
MKAFDRWWVVVGSAFGLLVGNGPIMQFTFGIFLLPITQEFGWSRAAMSSALVVGLTMTALCVPLAGRLVDRFGIRRVTLAAITLFALCLAAVSQFATTPTRFVVLYALMGVAAAGQTPLPYAKAIASWFDSKRGLALGIAMSGVGLGAALVPQYAQYLLAHFGWRQAYLGLAVAVFIIGFSAVGLAVKEADASKPQAGSKPIALAGLSGAEALRSGVFWKLAFAFFAVALATNGAIAHVVPLLVDRGISPGVAASAMAFAGLALTGGRLFAGYLLDRLFAPFVGVIFFLMPLTGIVILLSGAGTQYVAFAIVLIGMGLGAEVDLIAYLLSRYLGMRAFGLIYGYLFAIFVLGSGAGPYLMGLSFDKAGSYSPALFGLAACLVVASYLLLRLGAYVYPVARPSEKATPATQTA